MYHYYITNNIKPYLLSLPLLFSLFFFNDTATTEIYTLSLHDALPISRNTESGPALASSPYQVLSTLCTKTPDSPPQPQHWPGKQKRVNDPRERNIHRSEEHTSELQSQSNLVCRLLLEKKKTKQKQTSL